MISNKRIATCGDVNKSSRIWSAGRITLFRRHEEELYIACVISSEFAEISYSGIFFTFDVMTEVIFSDLTCKLWRAIK